jgi:hypothetical protein
MKTLTHAYNMWKKISRESGGSKRSYKRIVHLPGYLGTHDYIDWTEILKTLNNGCALRI